jgi:hypothetical protein
MYGSNLPDTRGLFLRGTGGNAAPLGQIQEDAMLPITGSFIGATAVILSGPERVRGDGAFTRGQGWETWRTGNNAPNPWYFEMLFNSANLGPRYDGPETRPVNMAARFIIKATK